MASLRQLARLIGVDEKSIRKAEKAGVFRTALKRGDDGALLYLDVSAAVDLWEKSGRRLRGSTPPAASTSQATAASPAAAVPPPALVPPPAPPLGGDGEDLFAGADGDMPPLPADAPPSLVDAQIATMRERQRKLRLENDEREGLLVDVERVSRERFEFARTLRENILNIPLRLAAELAAESDATRVHFALESALRQALEATANSLETAPVEQGVSA
jgi:hypothetical protein